MSFSLSLKELTISAGATSPMSPTADAFLRSWPFEPWLDAALLLAAAIYLNGWRERYPAGVWDPPPGLIERRIDAYNGDLANEWCPVTQREWFKPGTEPTRLCREHDAPLLEQLEGLGRKLEKALKGILAEL